MSESKARRGRPRQFDEAIVLEAVLDVFWRRGFSGATLFDLAAAAGITRPSLYKALGDKLSMYLRSLAQFEDALRLQLQTSLAPSRPLADGLLDFYVNAIDIYLSGGAQPRGCLAVCTAATEAVEEADIRAALADILDLMDDAFEARFRLEAEASEYAKKADPAALATLASATLHSLAVRARAGQGRERLVALASAAALTLATLMAEHPR